ncbi:CehA/McbA family metallohydrolase [Telluria aromaticivorans]|uniref:Ig-like domain repeat protein n=1 Tax=Telluria aromaticivorans TaxID=2725995 RepID=A0A7Y2K3W3_9BURK|nr:CehA/McbA family metallohydrolase [Telluria aromaticivorans]NNG25009.1 Ig-like domain repeat protein [Telluria aromaticivorans]
MRRIHTLKLLPLVLALGISQAGFASEADHREFEATLHAPYNAAVSAQEGRTFALKFSYPFVEQAHDIAWRLELVDPAQRIIERWQGSELLSKKAVDVKVNWAGRAGDPALRDGIYQVRMIAVAKEKDGRANRKLSGAEIGAILDARNDSGHRIEQSWDIVVGDAGAVPMPAFQPLPTGAGKESASPAAAKSGSTQAIPGTVSPASVPATASLPYTVYYANLHSQTNHSDGGGALASCTSSESPQAGAFGPTDAFTYAKNRGLDILMASEHNHMYDGSSSTNTAASPATAKALYAAGLKAAADFNLANPNFLAVYGLEWGVINNGGHLNILNSTELLQWEYNASNQLLGDAFTAKTDYAALYTLMKNRGYIGQFNHPETSGQFLVNGVALGYTADGDEAMALCEVMNTSAFSTNTTESETGRSTYESACKKALEAGFHIAFTTNQDNHCANWGASYTNRTGVLIPTGTALTNASFVDALRARRVFATMDKTSQLVLTANGRVMGERITNSGPLTLVANFANTSGKTVSSVAIFEGVPKRNGTVTQLSTSANTTITPSLGEHFYYAKITQSDGKILWSAPIWVTQAAGSGDTVAPTVSASESGSSGTITLSATASDNVGVTKVEFYVDNLLTGTDTAAPYSMTLNSTTLSNGAHTLTAKAYDAAGNVATSSAAAFSITNGGGTGGTQLLANPGFESGAVSWSGGSGIINNAAATAPRTGSWEAKFAGTGATRTDNLYQQVAIPSSAASATLSFWLQVGSAETTTTSAFDTLKLQVRSSGGTVLATPATYSNLNKGTGYVQRTVDLTAYKGQTVQVFFAAAEDSSLQTTFLVDDVALTVQ